MAHIYPVNAKHSNHQPTLFGTVIKQMFVYETESRMWLAGWLAYSINRFAAAIFAAVSNVPSPSNIDMAFDDWWAQCTCAAVGVDSLVLAVVSV